MTVEGQGENDSAEVTDAQEQAAYLAEMANSDDADAKVPVKTEEEKPEQAANADEQKAGQMPPAPERKEVIAGYTEEEVKAALEQLPKLQKYLDTTNGRLGQKLDEQQRIIEELRQQRQTAAGVKPGTLKRLSQEFPDLAKLLEEDLSESVGGQQVDPAYISQLFGQKLQEVDQKLQEKERALEVKALNRQHKDWRQIAAYTATPDGAIQWNNPQFAQWVAKQPQEVVQNLVGGWDADYISERLTEFKDSIKPKEDAKAAKKQVLENAVIPKGSGGRVVGNDLSEEEAAYRAEMAAM